MLLLSDALAVLGSRHGVIFNPSLGQCSVVRFDTFETAPRFGLRAGIRIGDAAKVFPLCSGGTRFALCDQRTAPASIQWIGLEASSALKVVLDVVIPFRPADLEWSSVPVLVFKLQVERLPGQFRWCKPAMHPETVELFFELEEGGDLTIAPGAEAEEMAVSFTSWRTPDNDPECPRQPRDAVPQRDAWVSPGAQRTTRGFSLTVRPGGDEALSVYWCAFPPAALAIAGGRRPFWFQRTVSDLPAVARWARNNAARIERESRRLARLVSHEKLSCAWTHLLSYTLHSWLINTWLVEDGGRPWFSVWEGSCYFHSTLDVEFTQAPFYLALWPELLRIQLEQWARRAVAVDDGAENPTARAAFMPHDVGRYSEIKDEAVYPHAMEVEETANFLLLVYAYTRRTGDRDLVERQAGLLERLVGYLEVASTDASGVPGRGVANTIDDGSPAIQFGRKQVYLAVKTLAALRASVVLLHDSAALARRAAWSDQAERIKNTVETAGWQGDHYGVLLEASGKLTDPWTGREQTYDEIPGWSAHHIYVTNTFALLDMVGFDVGLDPNRIRQDLQTSTVRCLREYGCVHTDYKAAGLADRPPVPGGLVGRAPEPGWISMNMIRDLAALRRGVSLPENLEARYWEWQVLTNTHGPAQLFFETFNGNHLCFYPRGVGCWAIFEAISHTVVDRFTGREEARRSCEGPGVPDLLAVRWSDDPVVCHS